SKEEKELDILRERVKLFEDLEKNRTLTKDELQGRKELDKEIDKREKTVEEQKLARFKELQKKEQRSPEDAAEFDALKDPINDLFRKAIRFKVLTAEGAKHPLTEQEA